jgi:beta-N-acetylhexosaminidase
VPIGLEPPAAVDPVIQYADDRLASMSLDEKVRSLFMVHLAGTDATSLATFAGSAGAGGVILMGDNVPAPADGLAAMTPVIAGEAALPRLIAIDQEGGIVRRIRTDEALSAEQLRGLDPSAAREAFATRADLLASLGITVNFGIVADVTGDPASFIYERSMGSTGADAAARVAEAVEGELGTVLSTLKHFPGHGVAAGDSHSSIPTASISLDAWRADHEKPFAAGIEAGAEFVMLGHLQFDAIDPEPATFSGFWNNILRDELGFDGIIITDDMVMLQNSGVPEYANPSANAVRALAAGATMLLYVGPVDVTAVTAAVVAAVDAGTITEAQIDDAAHRLLVVRRTLSGQTGPFVHCDDACRAAVS